MDCLLGTENPMSWKPLLKFVACLHVAEVDSRCDHGAWNIGLYHFITELAAHDRFS